MYNKKKNNNRNSDASIEQNTQQQPQQEEGTPQQQMQLAVTAVRTRASTNRSRTLATSKARARATSLIYLPPFCQPCGHVPAATAAAAASASVSSTSCSSTTTSRCCCCCCSSSREHKNDDKHATVPTVTTAGAGAAILCPASVAVAVAVSASSSPATPLELAHKFLQRDIQFSVAPSCNALRRSTQLVMPIVVGGSNSNSHGSVSECLRRQRQRRERMRIERQSQGATQLDTIKPISSATATRTTTAATATTTTNSSQTTTTTKIDEEKLNEQLVEDEDEDEDDDEDDKCRCYNYNGDISALERLEQEKEREAGRQQQQPQEEMERQQQQQQTLPEWYQLPSITWLKFWQQQLCNSNSSSRNGSSDASNFANATTLTTNITTTTAAVATTTTTAATAATATTIDRSRGRSCGSNSMTSTKSWLRALWLTLLLATSVSGWGGRQDAPTNCTFPARWEGSWFLSGYQQSIHIKGSQFSYRGRCAASDGNKYLIVDEKGCHRCLVIYEKHKNVLQYKESPPDHCKGRETLQNLCDQIPGDALLYSLFRESAEPVKCPLKGPFIFTYNRGHGECKSPVSNIESCTEESRLLLSFQACPDVQGTESTVEELTCLATWKDGNSRYLVGLVSHHHAISNEERYRCFVYEKISSLMGGPSMLSSKDAEYKLAQSGDATCNGLDSAEVGSRIMSLRKPPAAERCDFPAWFKGPRHWHALMGNAVYNYHSNDGSVHIIKPNGYMETRALCEQINKQTSTEMMAVVHYTTGCQSGFMCMMFYRRDTHVIEIQTGKPAIRLEDACAPDHFDFNKMAYITLLASNPEPHICPMEGLYNLRGAIGPPYLVTRHKRNHNGKSHLGHGHHHHQNDGLETGSFGHKGHSTLSFRNAERMERGSWHANTRGLPARSRRNAAEPRPDHQQESSNRLQQVLVLNSSNDTSVGFIATRSRRDVPGCVTNYNAQRQLWVGCTAPNVIDVSPLCSLDGEEEYSCHGSWSENSTVYIIARHKGTKHGVCISYRPSDGNAAKLVVGDACYRGTQKPPDHHLVANLSFFGKCGETGSSASSSAHLTIWLLLLVMLTWPTLLELHNFSNLVDGLSQGSAH
ncbi:uncharacterized protein LOC6575495 isoform X3 [Drosophila mojavensis]|uniref:uncharacterized protein LOC6575495 isoform X3 n=1 Tax=Drosophila mojavensis TaxID=7230 RepID=UPI001CD133C3|nr:uncharacterized protein LOC6575495 isoform X3 [Drosophila mojavensis]